MIWTIQTRHISKRARAALEEVKASITEQNEFWVIVTEAEQVSIRQMEGWKPMGTSTSYKLTSGVVVTQQKGRYPEDATTFDDLDVYTNTQG